MTRGPRQIRIGLLGAAKIAPLAIIRPASAVAGVQAAAIAARDPNRAAAFAASHGVPTVHASYEALIADPDLDLIYNGLPIDLHAAWSIRALEAGKHVLCEKPFAMNRAEVEAMQAAAARSGRRVFEALHTLHHPVMAEALALIGSGAIGPVRHVTGVFAKPIPDRPGQIRHRPEHGGGAMMDLGCYMLMWAIAVTGEGPGEVWADARLTPTGVDMAMEARLAFSDGRTARLYAAMDEDAPVDVVVEGEAGRLMVRHATAPHHGGSLELETEAGTERFPVSPITTYAYQLGAISTALETGAVLGCEGAASLVQQDALDRIYAAAGLGHLRA